MKGTILNISENEILIRGDDGQKYVTDQSQLKSEVKPKVGDAVDFEADENKATDVYVLRATSEFEHIASSAKEKAGAAYTKVRGQFNEENAEKVKAFTSSAASKAKALGQSISAKASTAVGEDFSGKASSVLSGAGNGPIQNKFSIFSLALLIITGFFSVVSFMGQTATFYEVTESYWMIIFSLAGIAVAFLGLPAIAYRVVAGVTLLFVLVPVYEGIRLVNEGATAMRNFGGKVDNPFAVVSEFLGFGAVLLCVATVLVVVSMLPGMYKPKAAAITSNEVHL